MKKQKDKTGKCIYLRDLLNRGIHFDETSQFETSFFSDVYENAIDAVEEIVNDNRKKEKIVGERRKDQRVRSIANVISFIGRRGTGKSSVMMSFQDALRQYTNDYYQCEKYNNLIFGKEADMGNVRFFSLDYIDASALEESEDVFILVLANMLNYLYSLKSFSDEYNDNSKRELISSFERIYEEFLTLKNSRQDRDGVYSSFETLLNVASSQKIRERFYNLVQQFIRYIRTNTAERAKECYMVISIDDLDMAHYNTQNSNKTRSKINNKSYEIVNSIHKYFSIPGVIVLTAYNYENLMLQSEKFFIESDKTANEKYHEKESQQMTSSRLASQFVDKVFPPAYRVYLPSWKKNDFGSSSTRIDISTGISGENLLGKYIENTDPTLTIKKFILALYAEKTSIFYDPLGKKIHFLEPDSLRKIVDIVAIFEGVEKTEDYTEQKERILKKIKADAYFRFVQEKLFLSEERTYFAELQELRIDRRSQEIVREFCGKIPRLGKAVKKDSDQYRKNMQRIALKKGYTVVDYSKIDDIIAKREDNSNIKYSLAEFIHCIYHMTRNSEKYSKEMVACILNSYTVHLSELFFEYQNEKRKMDMNEYTSYMQSKRNDVMLKSQQQNEEDHDYEKINEIQEIFEELIGDSVCGRWTEYFFPETYVFIPGAADPSNISENVIIGCANITHLTNRFTITSSHKKGLYHAVRTWIMFGMIYVDVLEWNSLDVVMKQSESNASITIQIPGNTQRIEMLAFLKHSFEYSKYLDKMKELMEYSLLHKFGFRTERNIKMTVNRAIEDVREEYIKWDYNYGNMVLPVYDFDLFYNLIKRIYQQTSKTERCVRIDTGFDFMDEMMKTNQLFVDYLNQIDEYYKIDSNLKFSEIFEQCPFVQWIHEKKDEEVMKSIGYIFKNMITDVANANRLERSGDDVPRTDV